MDSVPVELIAIGGIPIGLIILILFCAYNDATKTKSDDGKIHDSDFIWNKPGYTPPKRYVSNTYKHLNPKTPEEIQAETGDQIARAVSRALAERDATQAKLDAMQAKLDAMQAKLDKFLRGGTKDTGTKDTGSKDTGRTGRYRYGRGGYH